MVDGLPSLIEPLDVGTFTLRNRLVMPPMQTGRASFQGEVTTKLISFYALRSKMVGLPIVEHAYVSAAGKIGPKQLGIYSDSLIDGLEKLVRAIHEAGAPAIIQISHAGGVTNKKVTGMQPLSPTARPKTRMILESEIGALAEEFTLAADRAVNAGFDGVELHGAHGYLLNQFFSPLFNKRDDEFGGNLQRRMRLPLLVTQKVRSRLKGKLLLYRLGSDDLAPNGTHISDSIIFAKELQQVGVDIIDVSGGMCGSEPKQLRHKMGYFIPQAYEIKKNVKVPVIGVGAIKDAEYANKLTTEGVVDLVAVGRALLKDSKWADKAMNKLRNLDSII
jgi:2,4-dienoyl-CoA reductase-like NADH-dependent reductase (Old Yellow Enzyme family)